MAKAWTAKEELKKGSITKADDDEPVFVLRAQDQFAADNMSAETSLSMAP